MTREPATANTLRLLTALAVPPDDTATASDAVAELRATVYEIRAFLAQADEHDTQAVSSEVLRRWRNALARSHRALEQTDPDEWSRWRLPGTWLDSHLRLRSLIAHEVGKAYWDDRPEVRYAEIDIDRYLWGAR
ncbi:hypothetical protein [Streptomyces sp. 8L]|uniref:hypothetical protein n=1 Tax=Streptomyces sp. 8L TaxID=2877242 RepID=UPI001CD3CDFE|nr:hypothetical protein [Streptomyces sp. 8L]MCA1220000.1 hypothetical protein [Streptomyces sp. 8L]